MRVLVTGATGFIGSRLTMAAAALGHAAVAAGLTATSATATNAERLRQAGIEVRVGPIEDLAREPAALSGLDAIIHLAAAQHEMGVPNAHFRQVNVEATAGLLAAARTARVGRFVYGSTIGIYGHTNGQVNENTPPAPDNIYGLTKHEAEQLVLAEAASLPVVVMRISEAYGPGDTRLLKLFRAIGRGRFFHIGEGANLHHPIYVDDLVQGLLLGATHPGAAGEVFVLPGKEVVTTNQMVDAIATALEVPRPKLRLPVWPFLGAASVMETVLRPLRIEPPLHRRRMDFFVKNFRLDGAKVLSGLGFAPETSFAQGARRTALWYREGGML
jgi:dihydroflavonol-4-reductase